MVMVARELPNNPLAADCETEVGPDFETDHNFLEKQMKIKTSELTDAALDCAVAICEHNVGWEPEGEDRDCYSTNWAQGGPIIDREIDQLTRARLSISAVEWEAVAQGNDQCTATGPTPLIAAMRCYVASKLGDTVDVPDEIC
jgi:hypothetical protein